VKAEAYKKNAEDCLERASDSVSAGDKSRWLQLAQAWQRLAEKAEKEATKKRKAIE
jgi:hypothetical protein